MECFQLRRAIGSETTLRQSRIYAASSIPDALSEAGCGLAGGRSQDSADALSAQSLPPRNHRGPGSPEPSTPYDEVPALLAPHGGPGLRAVSSQTSSAVQPGMTCLVPFGVDEPGPADHPAFRGRGGGSPAVSAGASFEVDVAEREGERTWS